MQNRHLSKNTMWRKILGILLGVTMTVSLLAGCSLPFSKGGEDAGVVHEVKIKLSNPEGVRSVVESEAAVLVPAYLTARAYFDKLKNYNLNDFDADEYLDTVRKAYNSAEIAEKLAEKLYSDCDELITIQDAGTKTAAPATMEEVALLEKIPSDTLLNPLITPVYAAKKSPSVQWAEEITKTFDSAPTGKKLKTLAEQMGTDVKHAKKAMEMAQDIISGDAYYEQAEVENLCYQRCFEIKATSSVVGFAVSIPVTAAGAATAGAVASAVAWGGVACGGCSAVLDVGTAGTIVYTNGEGNEYTKAFEDTATQFAPINSTFALANAAVNVINIGKAIKAGTNSPEFTKTMVEEGGQLLTFIGNEGVNISASDGTSILGGTFSKTDNGWEITMMDTILGTSSTEKEAASEVLKNAGVSEDVAEEAVDVIAGEIKSGDWPTDSEISYEEPLPADDMIEQWDGFNDENNPFDADAFIYLTELAMDEASDGSGYAGEDSGYSENEWGDEWDEDSGEGFGENSGEGSEGGDGISGLYTVNITNSYGPGDSTEARVVLNDDNTMTIDIDFHALNDDLSLNMNDIGSKVHLVGTYDPNTMTFTGQGDAPSTDAMGDSFWNICETVLHFDTNGNVSGTNAAGETSFGMSCESQISMSKKSSGSSSLTSNRVEGIYYCRGFSELYGKDIDATYIFTATGPNSLTISDDEQTEDKFEGHYDPNTGMFSVSDEEGSIEARFTENGNGKIMVNVKLLIDGVLFLEGSGSKQ